MPKLRVKNLIAMHNVSLLCYYIISPSRPVFAECHCVVYIKYKCKSNLGQIFRDQKMTRIYGNKI